MDTAVAAMPPKIIWPSRPRFQNPMRNARPAPSPTRISGAARTNTARRLSALNTPASSLARSSGAMPARSRIATEMTSPIASEPARMPACFHGEMVWRMSSVKRPMPRRGDGFGAGDGGGSSLTIVTTSCMLHHCAANLLTVSGPVEFGDDPPPCHDPDPIGEGKNFVEVFADEHYCSSTVAGGQQPLMHRGTGPHIKPTAWAVSYDHPRLTTEFAGDHPFLGIAPREQGCLLPDAANTLHIVGGDGLGGVAAHGATVDQPWWSVTA